MRLSAAVLAIGLALAPVAIVAAPTLAETDAWLRENLPNLAVGDDGYDSVVSSVAYKINECKLHVRLQFEARKSNGLSATKYYRIAFRPYPGRLLQVGDGSMRKDPLRDGMLTMAYTENVTLDLSNVDLGSVRAEPLSLNGDQPETSAALLMTFTPKQVFIPSTNADIIERSVKALTTAAKLCGAKASAF